MLLDLLRRSLTIFVTFASMATIMLLAQHVSAQEGGEPDQDMAGSHMPNGHIIEPWMYEDFRQNVRRYRNFSDEQIDAAMAGMLPNYHVYLSDAELQGDVGILVLVHGSGEVGDQVFRDRISPLGRKYPTAIGHGMSMAQSSHLQSAVDDLVAAGAQKIVVVPSYHSPFTNQIRNWKYIFGISDEPGWVALPRIETSAEIIFASTLKDHPLAVGILVDYAAEIGTDPSNEAVVVLAHGPAHDADNKNYLKILESLASQLREKAGYADVMAASLQNDAPDEVRAENVQRIRDWIEEATTSGKRVLVVTTLETPSGLHEKIQQDDLAGLEFEMHFEGLVEHPNFIKWIEASALESLSAD